MLLGSIAPCHPFGSPAAARVSVLDHPWNMFTSAWHSRALALASWRTVMQTCTFSAGLTSLRSSAPSPFPAHQLHSSHHVFLTLQLCLSFISLPIPHLAFCPLCLHGSQFCSHRSHLSLPDPLHTKVQHGVTPTFQRHVLMQLQTAVSRLRTGVLTASSNRHQT